MSRDSMIGVGLVEVSVPSIEGFIQPLLTSGHARMT